MMSFKLELGDCLDVLKTIPCSSIDSIVTDPPYGIGFMGKNWDSVVPDTQIWQECIRVLKPGAHVLSFAGTRTQHRMAVAIEDAGFEIRDMLAWVYGSGFPNSMSASKAIEKSLGEQLPPAEMAEILNKWGGWGTRLKPAIEPITLARKPFSGTLAINLAAGNAGAINIDECRVPFESEADRERALSKNRHSEYDREESCKNGIYHSRKAMKTDYCATARYPANLIHDGSEEISQVFPVDAGGFSAGRIFYQAKASKEDRGAGNNHPTVKPTDLMRYLCRLITPNGGTVLDPFMGSGSTGKAALQEGFSFIGIEKESAYFDLAQRRLIEMEEALNA
jgi:DNA modification methylase